MRVLFTTTPGWGHVHPMVPLAEAFVQRGDAVAWASARELGPRLANEGFDTMAAGLSASESQSEFYRRFPEVASLPPAEVPAFMFPRLFGSVRAGPMLADLVPIVAGWKPSVIVHEAGEFAGPIAAKIAGVPSVCHAFGGLTPEPRVAAAGVEVAPLWEAHGLEASPYGGAYDHLYLDIYPESLHAEDMSHVARLQPLRPGSFALAGDEPPPLWLGGEKSRPVVYVTFGTVFNKDTALIATVVEGLRELPVRVIVTVGPAGDPAALGEQPDHVHVARYIPQAGLLPSCAAVVSHGGSGTFLAALASGLPQLCLPQSADQFLNAAACEGAGAGLALLPGQVTVGSVRGAAERVLGDRDLRGSAERLAREIAEMPDPGLVAATIHDRFS